jgi:serine/threonine protein kinase
VKEGLERYIWQNTRNQANRLLLSSLASVISVRRKVYIKVHQANLINEIYRESKTLKMLDNKHIVTLYHAFIYKKDLVLIMEYAGHGELHELLCNKGGKLPELEVKHLFGQIIQGI